MSNIEIINQVLTLFFMMIMGYYGAKKGFINKTVEKGMSELLLNITLPFLIVTSFNIDYSEELLGNALKILIYSIVIHGSLLLVTKLLYIKNKSEKQGILRFVTTFSNVGFMGYPILNSVLGPIAVFYAAMFNMGFNLFLWTIGVRLLDNNEKGSFKKAITNPSMIAVLAGIILFITPLDLPLPIKEGVKRLGNTTTPISMIIIGSMLSKVKMKDLFSDLSLYYGSFNILILVPFIVLFIMKTFRIDKSLMEICVIIEAMPGATLAPIIINGYGKDASYASKAVFISTLISMITIPIIIIAVI